MDTLSKRVYNVDIFSAELYEATAEAEELDADIRQNLEVLGYGE